MKNGVYIGLERKTETGPWPLVGETELSVPDLSEKIRGWAITKWDLANLKKDPESRFIGCTGSFLGYLFKSDVSVNNEAKSPTHSSNFSLTVYAGKFGGTTQWMAYRYFIDSKKGYPQVASDYSFLTRVDSGHNWVHYQIPLGWKVTMERDIIGQDIFLPFKRVEKYWPQPVFDPNKWMSLGRVQALLNKGATNDLTALSKAPDSMVRAAALRLIEQINAIDKEWPQ